MEFLTLENFDIKTSKGLVLIDFYADWCGPCKMMNPVLEEFSKKNSEKVKVFKVNVDEQRMLATKFQIMSIPTFILLLDGKVVKKFMGYMTSKQLEENIKPFI